MGARGFFSSLIPGGAARSQERVKKYTLGMSYFFVVIKSTD